MSKKSTKDAMERAQQPPTRGSTIWCDVEEVEIECGSGFDVEGVQATCARCGHQTQSYGTSDRSAKRCLVLLREECPNGEANYYQDAADRPASKARDVNGKTLAALDRLYGSRVKP